MHNELFAELLAAVGAALSSAPLRERQLLAEAVERYTALFPTTFLNPRSADATRLLRELFAEITDVSMLSPARPLSHKGASAGRLMA